MHICYSAIAIRSPTTRLESSHLIKLDHSRAAVDSMARVACELVRLDDDGCDVTVSLSPDEVADSELLQSMLSAGDHPDSNSQAAIGLLAIRPRDMAQRCARHRRRFVQSARCIQGARSGVAKVLGLAGSPRGPARCRSCCQATGFHEDSMRPCDRFMMIVKSCLGRPHTLHTCPTAAQLVHAACSQSSCCR